MPTYKPEGMLIDTVPNRQAFKSMTALMEAQASGLPVVQWLDPDNVDQIKVGVNGYLFETAEEFGRIIHQLAAVTPEQRIELAKRVRDSVKERSSDSIANYLLDLYQQAINKHR